MQNYAQGDESSGTRPFIVQHSATHLSDIPENTPWKRPKPSKSTFEVSESNSNMRVQRLSTQLP
jgi:hypothetical protein